MAAVTIYWYGPERPASRQCLARCAALFAGEPLAGAEERWPVQESEKGKPFFPLSPQTHCSVTHSGDYWLGAFSSEPIGIDLQIHKPGRLAALSRRFSIRRRTGICRLSDFRIFTGSGRQRRALSNFPAKGSAEISAGFPLPGRRGFCPGSMACSFGLCHFAVIIRYAFARKRFHRFNWCRENKHGA